MLFAADVNRLKFTNITIEKSLLWVCEWCFFFFLLLLQCHLQPFIKPAFIDAHLQGYGLQSHRVYIYICVYMCKIGDRLTLGWACMAPEKHIAPYLFLIHLLFSSSHTPATPASVSRDRIRSSPVRRLRVIVLGRNKRSRQKAADRSKGRAVAGQVALLHYTLCNCSSPTLELVYLRSSQNHR